VVLLFKPALQSLPLDARRLRTSYPAEVGNPARFLSFLQIDILTEAPTVIAVLPSSDVDFNLRHCEIARFGQDILTWPVSTFAIRH
jgi:hypothetical protein